MTGKYKILINHRLDLIEKVIRELVDTGQFVFTWERFKSFKELRLKWSEHELTQCGCWIIIGFHSECKRIITTCPNNWCRIEEFEEISLENFIKQYGIQKK